MGDKKLVELVDAWISAMNRVPRFLQLFEAAAPPPMGGEQAPSTVLMSGGLFGLLARDVRTFSPRLPNPLVLLNRRLLHPWLVRRRLLKDAKALGLEPRFARVLAERFERIWRSGQAHELSRSEQTARIVELLRQP